MSNHNISMNIINSCLSIQIDDGPIYKLSKEQTLGLFNGMANLLNYSVVPAPKINFIGVKIDD